MMLIVQKYGGTSVGNVERIRDVARKVAKTRDEGHDMVVVVSAMSGETDRLLSLAHEVSEAPAEREVDVLLSSGERVTIALLSIALNSMGYPAKAFTGRQVGIVTDGVHTKARIERVGGERVREALKQGIIPVIAGFQGISGESDVTTLGRGGSDLSAVAIAAALKADLCDIYTDVEGVFTADPNIVSEARKLDKVSYEEMLELASLGAKVLQNRSVEYAAKHGVKLRVLSTFKEGSGTLLTEEDAEMEKVAVSGVTCDRNQAKITIIGVPDRPGIAAKIFGPVADANIVVDMIIQNVSQESLTDISFTVPRPDVKKTIEMMRSVVRDIGARELEVKEDIAKVSAVGVGMRSHSGVAVRMFSVLSKEGINILMISTSEIKISCVIDAKYAELAVRALHRAFELEGEQQ
ncbi:MAG: aspartate kinase [Nitrospirota bacterium]|nr:aspartate kinase [Nitrospirota bacterium]